VLINKLLGQQFKMFNRETTLGYVLESAILQTSRVEDQGTDISNIVTDFEIYEHIDKPYLTGKIIFSDHGIVEAYNIMGGETLTLTIKCTIPKIEDSREIKKVFVIKEQLRSVKTNQKTEVVVFQLIEQHVFLSELININKAYNGNFGEIISEIMFSYLGKTVEYTDNIFEQNVKVIVPNMNPIATCLWFKNRITSTDQLPFFLFSNLGDDKLRLYDLGSMINKEPMNVSLPYVYSIASGTSQEMKKHVSIQSYDSRNTNDIQKLIRSGAVSSKTGFIDTTRGTVSEVKFDAREALSALSEKDYIPKIQSSINHGFNISANDKNIHEYESSISTYISSTSAYQEVSGGFNSFREEPKPQGYRNRINANAIFQFMIKSPLSIRVNGIDYIMGKTPDNYTLGRNVRVLFFNNLTEDRQGYDIAKSGDYMIYGTKHIFTKERYDTNLLLAKIANFDESSL